MPTYIWQQDSRCSRIFVTTTLTVHNCKYHASFQYRAHRTKYWYKSIWRMRARGDSYRLRKQVEGGGLEDIMYWQWNYQHNQTAIEPMPYLESTPHGTNMFFHKAFLFNFHHTSVIRIYCRAFIQMRYLDNTLLLYLWQLCSDLCFPFFVFIVIIIGSACVITKRISVESKRGTNFTESWEVFIPSLPFCFNICFTISDANDVLQLDITFTVQCQIFLCSLRRYGWLTWGWHNRCCVLWDSLGWEWRVWLWTARYFKIINCFMRLRHIRLVIQINRWFINIIICSVFCPIQMWEIGFRIMVAITEWFCCLVYFGFLPVFSVICNTI